VVTYPVQFPCASRVEGHSAAISAGLVRTPMEAGNTRQRRAQRVLPHQISLVFVIDQALYAGWLAWVNANAWDDWLTMKLPGLAASRLGTDTAPVAVRFMSDLQAELMPVYRLWFWRVRVSAEYMPLASDLVTGDSVTGGLPCSASPDWIIGGTAPVPSTDTISPGTPQAPATFF
jgi:hypothetical protein